MIQRIKAELTESEILPTCHERLIVYRNIIHLFKDRTHAFPIVTVMTTTRLSKE